MSLTISGPSQQYLADLATTQSQMEKAQEQVSSGHRLQQASDDPSALAMIYQLQTTIAQNQQVQTNLGSAQTELSAADTALQSAIANVQSAVALAAEGASTTSTAQDRSNLAAQVSQLLQSLVSLSNTQANGRYIFSGDQDTQPAYQMDAAQPNSVQQLLTPTSTRVIQDVNGTSIAVAKTAAEIFDARDASGAPTSGNVFAAVSSLLTALQNNDGAGAAQAADALKTAGEYLNGQLTFYGQAENRVTDAANLAKQFQIQEQGALDQISGADIPAAALALTKTQTQEQATLSVEAKIQQTPNLFSYLA